jgi:stage III sporulation protein AH
VLQTVVDSEDALESTKDQALFDISRIALEIAQESDIEALVKAKGFEQCVAVISGESVSVIVKNDGELLPGQAAQISEIVYQQTGILPTNVKILCK